MRSKIEEKIINLIKEIEAEESRYPQKRNPPGANQTGFKTKNQWVNYIKIYIENQSFSDVRVRAWSWPTNFQESMRS